MVEKKKKNGIVLKMSSKEEELYDTSFEDEDDKMDMLVCFSKRSMNGNWNKIFKRDQFRNESSRNNQITCYGCTQLGHM